jgi:hypothetical protein
MNSVLVRFVTVTKINFNEGRFILSHSFRGFIPWLAEGVVEESCSPRGSKGTERGEKGKGRDHEEDISFKGMLPVIYSSN